MLAIQSWDDRAGSRHPTPLPKDREPTVVNGLAALGCFVRNPGARLRPPWMWEDFSDAQLAEAAPLLAELSHVGPKAWRGSLG